MHRPVSGSHPCPDCRCQERAYKVTPFPPATYQEGPRGPRFDFDTGGAPRYSFGDVIGFWAILVVLGAILFVLAS